MFTPPDGSLIDQLSKCFFHHSRCWEHSIRTTTGIIPEETASVTINVKDCATFTHRHGRLDESSFLNEISHKSRIHLGKSPSRKLKAILSKKKNCSHSQLIHLILFSVFQMIFKQPWLQSPGGSSTKALHVCSCQCFGMTSILVSFLFGISISGITRGKGTAQSISTVYQIQFK